MSENEVRELLYLLEKLYGLPGLYCPLCDKARILARQIIVHRGELGGRYVQ